MKIIPIFLMILILFAIKYKNAKEEKVYFVGEKDQVKKLEYQKFKEIYLYLKDRYETLKELHNHNHRELKEAELKFKLARLDLLIANIELEMNLNEEDALK